MFHGHFRLSSYARHVSASTACFSTSSVRLADRAIVYSKNGEPSNVLSVLTYPTLPSPSAREVNVRFLLSPVNPADVNVIQGVYPDKPSRSTALHPEHRLPEPFFRAGNEGLAEVTHVGDAVKGLKRGDWVVMARQQAGTWASSITLSSEDVIRLKRNKISEVNAATVTVNQLTAYNLLHDFVELQEGDWIMQNGANSAVGQLVIQIAAKKGVRTINFVRNRPDMSVLRNHLKELGATQVFTYDNLEDRGLRNVMQEWSDFRPPSLLLNCVGGPATASMVRHLGPNAHLVTYGGMSKQPVSLPTSAFIFKNLRAHGFWQSQWNKTHSREEREDLIDELAELELKEPQHEIVTLEKSLTDAQAQDKVREIMTRIEKGEYGKKVLWKIEQPDD